MESNDRHMSGLFRPDQQLGVFAENIMTPAWKRHGVSERLAKGWPQLPLLDLEELAHKATTPRFDTVIPVAERATLLVIIMGSEVNYLKQYLTRLSTLHGIKEIHPDSGDLVRAAEIAARLSDYSGYRVRVVGVNNLGAFNQVIDHHMHTERLVGIAVDVLEPTTN